MASKSDKTMLAELANFCGKTGDFGAAANRYARLWTVKPGTDGTGGTEVAGGSYAAVECSGDFPTPSSGDTSISNTIAISWTTATAGWGDVVAVSMSTAATGTSSFIAIADLDNTVTVNSGVPFSLAIGALQYDANPA